MGLGKTTDLGEAEKEQIRDKLNRYLKYATYDNENHADDGNIRISIEPEDNHTIYRAVHSGDGSLKRLACEVVYRTNRRYFLKYAENTCRMLKTGRRRYKNCSVWSCIGILRSLTLPGQA